MSLNWPTPPAPPRPARGPATSAAPWEQRRGTVDRIKEMEARHTRIHGFVRVEGGGGAAATTDVFFPVWFMQFPNFLTGWSLEEGGIFDLDDPPRFDTGVVAWHVEERPMQIRYYSGAQILVTGFGPTTQRAVVHWSAEGKALRAPVAGSGMQTAEAPI